MATKNMFGSAVVQQIKETSRNEVIQDNDPKINIVTITPDMASDWIKLNISNRPVKQSLIRKYAKDITNGEWELNGESLKFGSDDRLLDGQHRLYAIYHANIAVRMFVITNLDPSTFHTVDTGRSRDITDVLHIKGELNRFVLSAALRQMFLHDKFDGDFSKSAGIKDGISIAELERTLDSHPNLRISATSSSQIVKTKLLTHSLATSFHYLISQVNMKKADEFFEKLTTGYDLGKGDPILVLRNTLLDLKTSGTRMNGTDRMAMCINAWNAFAKGEQPHSLLWKHDTDFPKVAGYVHPKKKK